MMVSAHRGPFVVGLSSSVVYNLSRWYPQRSDLWGLCRH